MPKTFLFGKGDYASCVLQFIHLRKPIREKYPNRLKYYNFENLVLIAEAKNTTRKNSDVSYIYTFLHADFEGVEFYAARRYVNLTEEERKEDFFVNEEE